MLKSFIVSILITNIIYQIYLMLMILLLISVCISAVSAMLSCSVVPRESYGFEPSRENYECAVRNLQLFSDQVHLYQKAVWRSDRKEDRLQLAPSHNLANTAGGSVIWSHGEEEVSAVAFDDIICDITDNGKHHVRMLKIDCEGSEFPILLTSKMLHLIDIIHGEFHEIAGEYDTLTIHRTFKDNRI